MNSLSRMSSMKELAKVSPAMKIILLGPCRISDQFRGVGRLVFSCDVC
jgi:hypothetical protein